MALTTEQSEIQNSLYLAVFDGNLQKIQNIFNSNSESDMQKVLRSQFSSGRFILDVAKSIKNEEIIQVLQQKANKYTNTFWNECKKIRDLLCYEVQYGNLKNVQNILNSNSDSYIQKALTDKFNGNHTILDVAIKEQEENIIKVLWQKANQDSRILLSDSAIKWDKCVDVKKFISEIENYERAINYYRKSYGTTKNFEEWTEEFIQKVKDYMKQEEDPAKKLEDVHCCEMNPSCKCRPPMQLRL